MLMISGESCGELAGPSGLAGPGQAGAGEPLFVLVLPVSTRRLEADQEPTVQSKYTRIADCAQHELREQCANRRLCHQTRDGRLFDLSDPQWDIQRSPDFHTAERWNLCASVLAQAVPAAGRAPLAL